MLTTKWLVFLHVLVGIGAVAGGIGGLLDLESMGITEEALVNGPFESFLIPVIFLLVVIGIGNLLAGGLLWRRWLYAPLLSLAHGGILCLWIVIQCYVLWLIAWLHVIFFVLGLVMIILAALLSITALLPTLVRWIE